MPIKTAECILPELLSGKEIFIRPIATHGLISIEIIGLEAHDDGIIAIYSISGVKIVEHAINGNLINMDISNNPSGVYIMNITLNDINKTWKIIKK